MKIATCKICFKSFTVKAGCKGIYCSRVCAESGKIIRARLFAKNNLILKQKNYQEFPNNCKYCNTPLSYEKRNNKFCSLSCSTKHNNADRKAAGWRHSNETKQKLREYALANPSGVFAHPELYRNGQGRKWAKMQIRICPTCKSDFETYAKWGKVFCSNACIKKGGIRSGSGRAKTGWYKGIYCGSTYELAFLIWNLDHNVKISRCVKSFEYEYEGKKRRYYPDFEIENQIFEIKGKLSDVDLVKIQAANAILIDKEKIKIYLNYVCKKYNLSKAKIHTLYE